MKFLKKLFNRLKPRQSKLRVYCENCAHGENPTNVHCGLFPKSMYRCVNFSEFTPKKKLENRHTESWYPGQGERSD